MNEKFKYIKIIGILSITLALTTFGTIFAINKYYENFYSNIDSALQLASDNNYEEALKKSNTSYYLKWMNEYTEHLSKNIFILETNEKNITNFKFENIKKFESISEKSIYSTDSLQNSEELILKQVEEEQIKLKKKKLKDYFINLFGNRIWKTNGTDVKYGFIFNKDKATFTITIGFQAVEYPIRDLRLEDGRFFIDIGNVYDSFEEMSISITDVETSSFNATIISKPGQKQLNATSLSELLKDRTTTELSNIWLENGRFEEEHS